jgi:hypothetical protein
MDNDVDRLGPELRKQLAGTAVNIDAAERRRVEAMQQQVGQQPAPTYDPYEEELAREERDLEAQLADVRQRRAQYQQQQARPQVDGEALDQQRLARVARQREALEQQEAEQNRMHEQRYGAKVAAGIVAPPEDVEGNEQAPGVAVRPGGDAA